MLIVFLMMSVFTVAILGASTVVLHENLIARGSSEAVKSYYAAEAGIEDAVYRVKTSKNYASSYTFSISQLTSDIAITGTSTKMITAQGKSSDIFKKIQTLLTINTINPQIFYGVQVGEGGVVMDENSRVEGAGGAPGNFYSNGSVIGANNAVITGDVTVAVAIAVDAQHTVYNSDFSMGSAAGSKITTVDSAGTTGTWASLAIGADGFARISYISGTTLKFARCTNDACTSPAITSLETGPGEGIGEKTSIVIGSDGFARISYYQDQDDDLKFIRCLNADCTMRNTTIVESAGNVGDDSALKIGLDGLPRIAYLYDTSDHLRYARCLDADCITKNIANVDTSGNVGEPHISLAIGLDGFGRISYYEDSGRNLNYVRCTNDDCTTSIITPVDTGGTVGQYTSIAVGSDGFARISYFDDSGDDLKFVRCTNDNCTTNVITTVDSAGSIGHWTSLVLGSDGYARISYYDAGNGHLKFVRCTNADCSAKNINTVDSSSSVGQYSSLGLGTDGFGRIAYYDASNTALKYAQCVDADCSPPILPGDMAQSFVPTQSNPLAKVSLYIKKVGNPSDATVRINADSSGSPATSSLASTSLSASLVTASYGWIDVVFSSPANVSAGTTYWVVFDGNQDASNYYVWGYDNGAGYPNGTAKYSEDWNSKPWFSIAGDMNFKTFVGTGASSIDNVVVYGTARANSITNSKICGDAYYKSVSTIDGSSKSFLDSPTNPTCGGNPLTPGTGFPNQPDPPVSAMPISQANIDQWKAEGEAGGIISGNCGDDGQAGGAAAVCTINDNGTVSLGPRKVTGNLVLTKKQTLNITGTVYFQGNIDIDSSSGATIKCDPSFGALSCTLITDGWIHIRNNVTLAGSGTSGSYILVLTELAGCDGSASQPPCTHHDAAIDLHNNAIGAIFYADSSLVNLHNGVNVSEITAYKLHLENNAIVTYESGLLNAQFSSGPGASYKITEWKEIP